MDLLPNHRKQLAASGIKPEIAEARGYQSISPEYAREILEPLGYSRGAWVGGLLIPLWDVAGAPAGSMFRLDNPKSDKGKYRFPVGQIRHLDVHPSIRERLRDVTQELWIVEGVKKEDALVSRELITIGLTGGVNGWRGSDESGGIAALGDWDDVVLNGGRVVHIGYDSDVVRKKQVYRELERFAKYLEYRKATVQICVLPDGEEKVGPDDFLLTHTTGEMTALSRPMAEVLPELKALHSKKKVVSVPAIMEQPHDHVETPLGELLDAIVAFIRQYVVLGSDHYYHAVALWVLHTWVYEQFDKSIYLDVFSPTQESGKTRLAEVLEWLVCRPLRSSNVSEAALFRILENAKPTVVLDEVDAMFKDADRKEMLRSLLNDGDRAGGSALRCEGKDHTPTMFKVYGPKMLLGIGRFLPTTIQSRSLPIPMKRKLKSEATRRYYIREAQAEAKPIHDAIATWAESEEAKNLGEFRPAPIYQVADRTEEGWRPLLAIAERAGSPWPARAMGALLAIHTQTRAEEGEDVATLWAVADVFTERGEQRLPSEVLVKALVDRQDGPWAKWWGREILSGAQIAAADLAKRLRVFEIRPQLLKFGEAVKRGYRREDFNDALARYPLPQTPVTPVTLQAHPTSATIFEAVTEGSGNGVENSLRDRPCPPSNEGNTPQPLPQENFDAKQASPVPDAADAMGVQVELDKEAPRVPA